MPFDIEGARKAGYTEEEIARYLETKADPSTPKFDVTPDKFDVQGALAAGYTEEEIANHLKSKGTAQPPVAQPQPSQYDQLLNQSGPRIWPMLKNLPGSLGNMAGGVAQFLGNIPQAGKDLGQVAAGGIEKLTGAGTGENIPKWEQFAGTMKERYSNPGKLMEEDPAGMMADISTILGGAGMLTKGGTLTKMGKLTNPLRMASKPITKAAQKATDLALGVTTGTSSREVAQARKVSTDFTDFMRGKRGGDELVKTVHESVKDLADKANAEYSAILPTIDATGITVNPYPVFNKYDSMLKDMRVSRDTKGALDFAGSVLEKQPAMQRELTKIDAYLNERKVGGIPMGMKPSDADIMKKWFWSEADKIGKGNIPTKSVAEKLYGEIANTLNDQVPQYKEMTANYAKFKEFETMLRDTLSLKDPKKIDASLSKLRSALRTDNDFRSKVLSQIQEQTGKNLMSMVAGYDMSQALPRGLIGRGIGLGEVSGAMYSSPWFLAALPFTSPRVVGELMQGIGKAGTITKRIPSQTPNILYQLGKPYNMLEKQE